MLFCWFLQPVAIIECCPINMKSIYLLAISLRNWILMDLFSLYFAFILMQTTRLNFKPHFYYGNIPFTRLFCKKKKPWWSSTRIPFKSKLSHIIAIHLFVSASIFQLWNRIFTPLLTHIYIFFQINFNNDIKNACELIL